MPRYGGETSYGGLERYGGGVNPWLVYYRIMKSVLLPGLWPQDDSAIMNRLLRKDAKGLSHAKIHQRRLLKESFPQTADEALDEWAALLGVVFGDGATLEQKRADLVAKWRGSLGSSLPAIRRILYPLLVPSTAFFDHFADEDVSKRYEREGNGTKSETGTLLTLDVLATVDASWDGSAFTPLANRAYIRLPDIDDDFTLDVLIDSVTLGADTAAGIFVEADAKNATHFVFGDDGAAKQRVDRIFGGSLTEDVDGAGAAPPALPELLRIQKLDGELIFFNGDDESSLAEFHRVDTIHKTRNIGIFTRNDAGSKNAVALVVDSFKLQMATPQNNVEIVELTEEIVDLGEADSIFTFFVHRDPSDPGSYDLKAAQRSLDRAAQAHTLGVVGESDEFLVDDEFSLTDRDILGS